MTIRNQATPVPAVQRSAGTAPMAAKAAEGTTATGRIGITDAVKAGATPDLNALKAEVAKLAPGSSLTGSWSTSQLQVLVGSLRVVPAALRKNLDNTSFVLNPGGELPGKAFALARNNPKSVTFQPAAFNLPADRLGIPGGQDVALHEFAHLVDHDPAHTQEFAKLSGWKETVFAKDGSILKPAKDANGVDRTGAWAEGNQVYADGSRLLYSHAAQAKFVAGTEARVDPRDDYAESFRTYINRPEELLSASPEKFLFINAETKAYPASQVEQWAARHRVDLEQVLTNLVVEERAYQPTVARIATFQGISANSVKLRANDHATLSKSVNVQGVVDRLGSELILAGKVTPKQLKDTVEARDAYRLLNEAKAPRADIEAAQLAFRRLPFEAQLKADPQLALGNTWFELSPKQRTMLTRPAYIDSLTARAMKQLKISEVPTAGAPTNPKDQAFDKVIAKLLEPGRDGFLFRAELGGLSGVAQNPVAALTKLGVWTSLPADQQAFFEKKANWSALNKMTSDPELVDTIFMLKEGSLGVNRLQTALNKERAGNSEGAANIIDAFGTTMSAVKTVRAAMVGNTGTTMLEMMLVEINRQVQGGNTEFIDKFTSNPSSSMTAIEKSQHMSNLVGAWVWDELSPSEQKMLSSLDYRRHLVKEASTSRATGSSLTEDFQVFGLQTGALQKALLQLAAPGAAGQRFRQELQQDAVGALKKAGVWEDLPDELKVRFNSTVPAERAKLAAALAAFGANAEALGAAAKAPEWTKLQAAIKGLTGDDYETVLNALNLDSPAAVAAELKKSLELARQTGEFTPEGHSTAG